LSGSPRIPPCPAITLHSLRVQDSIALAQSTAVLSAAEAIGLRWSGTAQARVGWQPSRFLADRAEAERAFQLAEQLGSVNAAVRELGTTWPSLRKAFTRHNLGMPARNPNLGMPARNPEAVRQRAIEAARQRSDQPAPVALNPVFVALNRPAGPRSAEQPSGMRGSAATRSTPSWAPTCWST
jgi:hypothetical protein